MASFHQPLLQTPSSSSSSSIRSNKLLYVFVTFAALIFSAVFLVTDLIKPSPFDLSVEYVPSSKPELGGISVLQNFLMEYSQRLDRAIHVGNKMKSRINDENEHAALADCLELMDLSVDRVADSVLALGNRTALSMADAHSWLSAVLTNHDTCLDGLQAVSRSSPSSSSPASSSVERVIEDLISGSRVSLAMLVAETTLPREKTVRKWKGRPSLLPSWIKPRDRKLLQMSAGDINADIVVAQDGSGNYQTVGEAVAAAPEKSKNRFVIYVKKGTYEENIEVGKKKKNVMIVGDGMSSTIITGSLNVVDGSTTFNSATLAAVGDGFILQDIWIQNTAGPEKHQAVALRVGADQSVINRCQIDAFQDTLYAHSNRQFYRDCFVIGTIDFIFGNAAVVLQNCKLVARKPMKNQKNMVTAQGRIDPNQNTGTSIQNCDIIPSLDLTPVKDSFKTYLGRPWKNFSRTVVMQSYIDDHIDPAGWMEWDKDFALQTLYYGEYMNRGPGAGTSRRVNWPGYRVITDPAEAMKFTVGELIQGGVWIKSTSVSFTEGL